MKSERYIHEGDYKVGDTVRIIWEDSRLYGKIGTVVLIQYMSVGIKLKSGEMEIFAYRSSVELVENQKVKVLFT